MKFEEYKEYISGTYENLSFEDRMYYVSFVFQKCKEELNYDKRTVL